MAAVRENRCSAWPLIAASCVPHVSQRVNISRRVVAVNQLERSGPVGQHADD